MTRRSRHSRPRALRRALLPVVGAIPVAVVVTCAGATGSAAAQPSVPAPAPFEQLWTNLVQHGGNPFPIVPPAAQRPGRVHLGTAAPALAPGADHAVRELPRMMRHAEPMRVIPWGNTRAAEPLRTGGLHPVPVDSNYSDRVTQQTVNGGTAGIVIGALVGGIPGAAFGAVPGAILGGSIGAIIGGVALAVPTLGMAAPLGIIGGGLAGAGVGAVVGAVAGALAAGIPIGIFGGVVGYLLGAATGIGNGSQG